MSETRKDWSLLSTWCENQAELEETESWMCAPPGERQEWAGAVEFYKLFASLDTSEIDAAAVERWLSGARQAADRISERVAQLAAAEDGEQL